MTAAALDEARRLLRIAQADWTACTALLSAPGVRFANAAFHGQQAVEKALKAVLTVHGCDFGRTHNLVALSGQLLQAGVFVPDVGESLSLLNPYAVTLRYDDIEHELMTPADLGKVVSVMLAWAGQQVDENY
jgi:HEPN domain-containing protein